jgi:hypothetical protein
MNFFEIFPYGVALIVAVVTGKTVSRNLPESLSDANAIISTGCAIAAAVLTIHFFYLFATLLDNLLKRKHKGKTTSSPACKENNLKHTSFKKETGFHLILLPPCELPKIPVFAPVKEQPRKVTLLQRFFAIDTVWVIGHLIIALMPAVIFIFLCAGSANEIMALIVASFCIGIAGVFISRFPLIILLYFRTKINGGPFHEGDTVQVITGKYAGKLARVYEEWPERNRVRVAINEEAWKSMDDAFFHVQLIKIPKSDT